MDEQAQQNRREARLPQVKDYLTSRKEPYKKRENCTEADGKEDCAICLQEFRESEEDPDYVVVLECGSASKKSSDQQNLQSSQKNKNLEQEKQEQIRVGPESEE